MFMFTAQVFQLSNSSKEKLSRLKGKTGIKNWNVLCRWALCFSLHEGTVPTDVPLNLDSNVEMSWYTFAGEYSEISVSEAFRKYCKAAGINYRSSHKARKTVISSLIDAGMNINTIREMVGHADERTTMNSYCYDRRTKDERIEILDNALSS